MGTPRTSTQPCMSFHLFLRFLMPVCLRLFLGLLILCPLQGTAKADGVSFIIDDGAAKTGGTLKVIVEWKNAAGNQKETIDVKVDAGDTRAQIRDKIKDGLKGNAKVNADFDITTDSAALGGYQICIGTS